MAADAGAAQPAQNIVRHRQRAIEHRERRGDVAIGVRIADGDAADRHADALGRTHRRGRHNVAGVVDLGDVDRHRVGGGERCALVLRRHRQRVAAVVALLQVSPAIDGGQRRIDLRHRASQGDRAAAIAADAGAAQPAHHIVRHRQHAS